MRYICELSNRVSETTMDLFLDQVQITYKNYLLVLGPERLYSLGYDVTLVKKAYDDLINSLEDSNFSFLERVLNYSKLLLISYNVLYFLLICIYCI